MNDFEPLITIKYKDYQYLISTQTQFKAEEFVVDAHMVMSLITLSRKYAVTLSHSSLSDNMFIEEVIMQLKRTNAQFAEAFKKVK